MARGKHEEGHGGSGAERYLLTYADLITLLMAFFVIMYSMSTVDAAKYASMAESLKVALGVSQPGPALVPNMMSGGNTKDQNDLKGARTNSQMLSIKDIKHVRDAKEERQFALLVKQIKQYAKRKGLISGIDANEDDRGVVINFSDKVLFDIGKADLSPSAKAILDDLAVIVMKSHKYIKVEGHTDNIPISNEQYPSNWQLSTDRATNVIMYWIERYPAMANYLSAAGYGEYRPVATNATPWGRAKNRRVEIVILRDLVSVGEPTNKTKELSHPLHDQKGVDLGDKIPETAK